MLLNVFIMLTEFTPQAILDLGKIVMHKEEAQLDLSKVT